MSTQRLYYDDSALDVFTARVVDRVVTPGGPGVVLDRTAFYPTGGGQPHDTGTIEDVAVIDVFTRPDDGAVIHVLAGPVTTDEVSGAVDWGRRFDHMQQHTGQHILSQSFIRTVDASTVGFHLTAENLTIDLDRADVSDAGIARAEQLANQVIWDDRLVTARIVTGDEVEAIRMRRLPDQIYTDGIRVVDIADFDQTACGGTHVVRTGSVGSIKIVGVERRGPKTRIEFVCGGRALNDHRDKHDLSARLGALLTTGRAELPDAIARLQASLSDATTELETARRYIADMRAEILLSGARARTTSGRRVVCSLEPAEHAPLLRQIASRLAAQPGVIALLACPSADRVQFVFAADPGAGADASTLLKQVLGALGGKGGGQPGLAQGSAICTPESAASALDAAADSLLNP